MFTMRSSLPTIDALEANPDPRDYSLLVDDDNVLIKEHSRGQGTANTLTIYHNLGYFPHFYAYAQVSSGRYQIVNGYNIFGQFISAAYTDRLVISRRSSGPADAPKRYFIFYDDIPTA